MRQIPQKLHTVLKLGTIYAPTSIVEVVRQSSAYRDGQPNKIKCRFSSKTYSNTHMI